MVTLSALSPMQFYIGLIISGICAGIGSAFGAYLVNKYVVAKTDAVINRLEDKVKTIQSKLKIRTSEDSKKLL